MPRVRRRPKLRRSDYSQSHVDQLLYGHDFFGDAFGHDDDLDVEAAKTAWEILGERLLTDWISSRPNTRPWGWWRFIAAEPRQRVDDTQHPFRDRLRKARVEALPLHCWARRHAYDLYFGLPRLVSTREEAAAQYESEKQYLCRLNLLTDSERKELL